jgi:hypothetical protein
MSTLQSYSSSTSIVGFTTTAPLPPQGHQRWTPRDKRHVVAAVCSGFLNLRDACERYTLSMEEFLDWYGQYKPEETHQPH